MDKIRRLNANEVDDIFVPGEVSAPALIAPDVPVLGEMIVDANGHLFLTPMPDERGGPRMAVLLRGPADPACARLIGEFVALAGLYDPAGGLQVTHIGRQGEPLQPTEGAAS